MLLERARKAKKYLPWVNWGLLDHWLELKDSHLAPIKLAELLALAARPYDVDTELSSPIWVELFWVYTPKYHDELNAPDMLDEPLLLKPRSIVEALRLNGKNSLPGESGCTITLPNIPVETDVKVIACCEICCNMLSK